MASPTSTRRRPLIFVLVGVVVAVLGGFLVVQGLPAPPVEAPLPQEPFSVEPSAQPTTGPTEKPEPGDDPDVVADANGNPMDPDGQNRLVIPATGTNAPVFRNEVIGGVLEPPLPASAVGIWTGGGQFGGDRGKVLITGHVAWNAEIGALYSLAKMEPGNLAYLIDGDGDTETFKLVAIESMHKSKLPASVYDGPSGERELVLVTCGGEITNTSHGRVYSDNVIARFVAVD